MTTDRTSELAQTQLASIPVYSTKLGSRHYEARGPVRGTFVAWSENAGISAVYHLAARCQAEQMDRPLRM